MIRIPTFHFPYFSTWKDFHIFQRGSMVYAGVGLYRVIHVSRCSMRRQSCTFKIGGGKCLSHVAYSSIGIPISDIENSPESCSRSYRQL